MKEIGKIAGAEMHGKVYETANGLFLFKCDEMYRDEHGGARWRQVESKEFPSLDELIASLPHPRLFRRPGELAIDPEELAAIHKLCKESSKASQGDGSHST